MARNKENMIKNNPEEESKYPESVEKQYKLILRIMSWLVGIAITAILILPEFNSPFLDKITKVIFIIGFVDLLLFLIIEFISNNIKNILLRMSDDN